VTTANVRPPYSSSASAFERSELDVSSEAKAVNLGEPARPQAITTEISFGSFRLLPAQRLLLDGNKPVQLGSRALDVLIALVERSSELVSKEELMTRVWPKIFVDPANLAVHVSALRRALRDGRNGNRFLINIPGRGYVFVAPVKSYGTARPSHPALPNVPLHTPPAHVDGLITGEPLVESSARLLHNRLVTVARLDRSKQPQFDRRRRRVRAVPLQRPPILNQLSARTNV
jgi:DNA-binding winged helix-turn-helix (wHTH) protein